MKAQAVSNILQGITLTDIPTPVLGMMRFNTADDRVEIYDASNNWVRVAGSSVLYSPGRRKYCNPDCDYNGINEWQRFLKIK